MMKPRNQFFEREEIRVTPKVILDEISTRPSDLLFIVIKENNANIPDVLWGQIYKSRQAIENQIKEHGFNLLRTFAWSNEATQHIFIYELESSIIPDTVKHIGPPVHLKDNAIQFINKYSKNPKTIAGPDILGDQWYVLYKRKYTNIKKLMDNLLSDGGRTIGVSRKLSQKILQDHSILLNEEIKEYLSDNFKNHLYQWLKGRPFWVE